MSALLGEHALKGAKNKDIAHRAYVFYTRKVP